MMERKQKSAVTLHAEQTSALEPTTKTWRLHTFFSPLARFLVQYAARVHCAYLQARFPVLVQHKRRRGHAWACPRAANEGHLLKKKRKGKQGGQGETQEKAKLARRGCREEPTDEKDEIEAVQKRASS